MRARVADSLNFNHLTIFTAAALPGASFTVNGAAQASDSALTTASAEMNDWSAAATFDSEFSNVTRSYVGKGCGPLPMVALIWRSPALPPSGNTQCSRSAHLSSFAIAVRGTWNDHEPV